MRDTSCLSQVSLVCMKRAIGVGRHTRVNPEAPALQAWGVVTEQHIIWNVPLSWEQCPD